MKNVIKEANWVGGSITYDSPCMNQRIDRLGFEIVILIVDLVPKYSVCNKILGWRNKEIC